MKGFKKCFATSVILGLCAMATAQEIKIGDVTIMSPSDFGITTNMRSWKGDVSIETVGKPVQLKPSYKMHLGKRSHCTNTGTEQTYALTNKEGDRLMLVLQRYRDGYAYYYRLTDAKPGEVIVSDDSRIHIPADANRWMQIYDGPGYEHYYPLCANGISPEKPKTTQWGQPALFEISSSSYALITESELSYNQCGSIFTNTAEDRNTYGIKLFDVISNPLPQNVADNKEMTTPTRVIITGTLADIVESTLVTDVCRSANEYEGTCKVYPTKKLWKWAEKAKLGPSSWIYWAYNHGSQEYDILKQYVDLAAEMHWPYTLIDAEWDVMRGGNIKQLCQYAVSKGVKPMIWYNSSTNWMGRWAPTPQWRLNYQDDCEREFAEIASWGVAGVKIDFFRADNRETINYYLRLLESAARHGLLVNFHGGTVPRSWQRTYPNLISCESVLGAEWYNNNGILTNKAAVHNATLPFTRNVIGSMDYTPGTFTDSQHQHITTNAHELALPFLFESGIQHMPDRPDTYLNLPQQVRELLMHMPTTWDDTKLLEGYPGNSCVLARRSGSTWYIAGINALDRQQNISFSLSRLGGAKHFKDMTLFTDTETESQERFPFLVSALTPKEQLIIQCKPRGGFVIVVR